MTDPGERVGQQFGSYRLVSLLGRGGFADVYQGLHVYLNSPAAIKVLYAKLTQEDLQVFLSEARTLVRLLHPHIVRVLDFGVTGTTPFLVMDYAPGGTLRQLHPKGTRLPLHIVVSYVWQIASALQYAHEQKLIHRDVKPDNLLIGRNREVLLSDFGIALVTQSSRYQSTRDMAGTVAYMAPEQIEAHPRPASDQYALGITVYEWLSGDRPFHGSFTEIAIKHATVPPPPLREKVPQLAPAVEQVVMTALAKDYSQRFVSIHAFAMALEQASRGSWSGQVSPIYETPAYGQPAPPAAALPTAGAIAGYPTPNQVLSSAGRMNTPVFSPFTTQASTPHMRTLPSAPWRIPAGVPTVPSLPLQGTSTSRRGISRRKVVLGLGLTGLALISGGAIWSAASHAIGSGGPTAAAPRQATPRPTPPPIPLGTRLYTYRGHSAAVTSLAWSPGDTRIASGSYDTTVQVWNVSDGSHVYTYNGHTSEIYDVAWSPDGKRIASCDMDGFVQVWDATDGGNAYTYRGHATGIFSVVSSVAWSPDSKRIASGGLDRTVQVWDATDGGHPYTYRDHTDVVNEVAWSPDGTRIVSSSFDKTVQVWDATDGGHSYVYRGHTDEVYVVAWSPDGKRIASGGLDRTVQLWDATDGSNAYTYRGHNGALQAVNWSPNSKRIVSGSDDGVVQIWDAANGGNAYIYHGHTGWIGDVAWSPDSRHIASGGLDRTVQVWGAGL